MIQSKLPAFKQKIIERREGVTYAVRQLLRRAGIDLLEPGEDLYVTEVERAIPLQDGSTYKMVFRTIEDVHFPVPGFVAK